MHSTSNKHLKKITNSRQSGTAQYTSESHYTEITDGDKFICHCQDTPTKHSNNSTTQKIKSTIPKHTHHIWGQNIYICDTTILSAAAWQKRKEIYSTGLRKKIFLGRAVYSTLLCPISAIASQSSTPTEETMRQTHQLLDYIVTQEDAVITYTSSDMKLAVHSDASYLSRHKSRSRAGGHFFLSNKATIPQNNGAILNIAHIIKHVMT